MTGCGRRTNTAGGRLDDLAEALPRIEKRWAALNPPPTRQIPVLIGGSGEKKTLRLVARHAHLWHSFADVATFDREARSSPTTARPSAGTADHRKIGARKRRRRPDEAGSELAERGVRLFTIGAGGPDYDLSPVRKWVAWRDRRNA